MRIIRTGMVFVAIAGIAAGCGSGPTVTRPPLSIRINLDHTEVMAGDPIHGMAVVNNETQRAITVNACPDEWLNVGLRNSQISYDPAVATVACAPSIRLQPGTTSFPVTVITTYGECAMTAPFTASLPRCGAAGPPPLPSGKYETAVITSGLPSGAYVLAPEVVTLKR